MIKLANKEDIDIIMTIIDNCKIEMNQKHNLQWNFQDDYPSKAKMLNDIENQMLYKYTEGRIIKGFLTIQFDEDREYDSLIKNSPDKAYIIHRLAVAKEYRQQGVAVKLMRFAEKKALSDNIYIIKIDTEENNYEMNHLLKKMNYNFIGNFTYDDYPGCYNYYEKLLKRSENL